MSLLPVRTAFIGLMSFALLTRCEVELTSLPRGCVIAHIQHKSAGATMMATFHERGRTLRPKEATRWYYDGNDTRLRLDAWRSMCAENNTLCDFMCEACVTSWGTLGNSNFIWEGPRCWPEMSRIARPQRNTSGNLLANSTTPQAHAFGLSGWLPGQCTLITYFREPISRIVSATLYCRTNSQGAW